MIEKIIIIAGGVFIVFVILALGFIILRTISGNPKCKKCKREMTYWFDVDILGYASNERFICTKCDEGKF